MTPAIRLPLVPRILIQTLLSVGVLPFYPFVLLFSLSALTPGFWQEASGFTLENWVFFLIYPAAALGVPALLVSIFASPAGIKKVKWLLYLVVAGLVAGSFTAVTFLAVTLTDNADGVGRHFSWISLWQIGGPLLVAFWNLGRLWREPAPDGLA
ncbi:MAG: hypothetical protein KIT44_06185 [Opitutaceae bacterium]|nr:hypothetical protein [Opitutaceae bacterium]